MEKLALNCPFCGELTPLEKPVPNVTYSFLSPFVNSDGNKKFHCYKCHSQGPKAINEEEALDKWNERFSSNNDSCPFCGSNDLGDKKYLDGPTYAIICKNCLAHGPEGDNMDDAEQKWAQRAI
jgi:hypothetical protein